MLLEQDVRIEIQDPNKDSQNYRPIDNNSSKNAICTNIGILESTSSSENQCNFLLSSYCEKHFSIRIGHVGMCMNFYF